MRLLTLTVLSVVPLLALAACIAESFLANRFYRRS